MGMTAEAYRDQLVALLPRGAAWNAAPGTVLEQLLDAAAQELARVDLRAANLLDETDPRTTNELIPDWERAFGLPDYCNDLAGTLSARRDAVVAKLTATGYQTPAYFVDVAARLGYAIVIEEFMDYEPGHVVNGVVIPPAQWPYVWRVHAANDTIREWTCMDPCTEPLRTWGNEQLECAIGRLKPAHTHVLYAYTAPGALFSRSRAKAFLTSTLT